MARLPGISAPWMASFSVMSAGANLATVQCLELALGYEMRERGERGSGGTKLVVAEEVKTLLSAS